MAGQHGPGVPVATLSSAARAWQNGKGVDTFRGISDVCTDVADVTSPRKRRQRHAQRDGCALPAYAGL